MDTHADQPGLEKLLFFYSFLRSPRTVGSVIPSSTFLSKKMVEDIDWKEARVVVELGAGTGVFTSRIWRLSQEGTRIFVYEKDEWLRRRIAKKFPGIHVNENACSLLSTLDQCGVAPGEVDVIISGLPFANFPPQWRQEMVDKVYQALKQDGKFVTFQYSLQMKKLLSKTFTDLSMEFVPLNIPPAVVYKCTK